MARGRGDRCRVVANPLGYANKGEQDGFRPGLIIDVPRREQPVSRGADPLSA